MKKLLLLTVLATLETAKPAEHIDQPQEIPDFPPDLPLNINNQPVPAVVLQRNRPLWQPAPLNEHQKQILQDGQHMIIYSIPFTNAYFELLHENNININTRHYGKTLLEIAALYNNYHAAQLLLEIGHANPNTPQCSTSHVSPLTHALALTYYSPNDQSIDCMISLLLSYNANIEIAYTPNEKKAELRVRQEQLRMLNKMKFAE